MGEVQKSLRSRLRALLHSLLSEAELASSGLQVTSSYDAFQHLLSSNTITVIVHNFTGVQFRIFHLAVNTSPETSLKALYRAVQLQFPSQGRKVNWRSVWRRYTLGTWTRPFPASGLLTLQENEPVRFHSIEAKGR